MLIETSEQKKFDSLTYRIETPDGTMFVTVMESNAGKPIAIQIHMGKVGAPLSAWSQAVAHIVTLALECGAGVNDVIKELSEHTSDRAPRVLLNGARIRSGPDGLCHALMKYRKEKYTQLVQTLGGDKEDERRGPRFG